MTIVNIEECDCSCHEDGSMHMVACCAQCQYCEKNINFESYSEHTENCILTHLDDK